MLTSHGRSPASSFGATHPVAAIVIRLTAKTGLSTDLVRCLSRGLPTEPGEAGDLFWMFLRADSDGDAVDAVGLFAGGDDFPLDEVQALDAVREVADGDLLDGEPRVTRIHRLAASSPKRP